MRNGVYRVWLKTSRGASSGAAVFKDGDVFAADRTLAYNGRYRIFGGRMTAKVQCTRLYPDDPLPAYPDIDSFNFTAEGAVGEEFALLTAVIDEVPDCSMTFECTYLGEA